MQNSASFILKMCVVFFSTRQYLDILLAADSITSKKDDIISKGRIVKAVNKHFASFWLGINIFQNNESTAVYMWQIKTACVRISYCYSRIPNGLLVTEIQIENSIRKLANSRTKRILEFQTEY